MTALQQSEDLPSRLRIEICFAATFHFAISVSNSLRVFCVAAISLHPFARDLPTPPTRVSVKFSQLLFVRRRRTRAELDLAGFFVEYKHDAGSGMV
jgi:hypothetical protein